MDLVETIAIICHQTNKEYCAAIGDSSQKDWGETSKEIKESARDGVKYHLDNPNSEPEDSHVNWSKFKIKEGWVYGEVKDEKKKTHPCLVDYDDLPVSQRAKDWMFLGIVRELEKKYGNDKK